MPFTLLAHQAPLVPIWRRWTDRVDGVALAVGSVVPDLAAASSLLGWGGFGVPLWIDGHAWSVQPQLALLGAAVAIVLRRSVMPFVGRLSPPGGRWHLADLQLVARRRPRFAATYLSALVGAVTHVVLDLFTHADRPLARWLTLLSVEVASVRSTPVRIADVLQIVLSLVLGVAMALWTLRFLENRGLVDRYGLDCSEVDGAMRTFEPPVRRAVAVVVPIAVAAAALVAVSVGEGRSARSIVMGAVVAGLGAIALVSAFVTFVAERLRLRRAG